MTHRRLAYDEASTASEMAADCRAVGRALRLTLPAPAPIVSQPAEPMQRAWLPASAAAARVAGRFLA